MRQKRKLLMLACLNSNNIKFADRSKPSSLVHIRAGDLDAGTLLSVEDNRVGIPQELLPRYCDLVERFSPHVAGGTGLGTTILKKHADAIGATISISSSADGTIVAMNIQI
jgi:light-regulated signal transduction histidine kinase (bacteriophytochrome)